VRHPKQGYKGLQRQKGLDSLGCFGCEIREGRVSATGGKVSEKSHVTRTSENPFDASTGHKMQYYVGVVKDKRTGSSSLGGVAIQTLNMIRGACN
jgi:hypothetical protein